MFANARIFRLAVVLLIATVFAAGCFKKQRAEISLKKTNQTLGEIDTKYDGKRHAPEKLTAIQTIVNDATGLLGSDANQAFEKANDAASQVALLLEEVKPKHADYLFGVAENEIKVARYNDLLRLDPERFKRLEQLSADASKAKGESKFDDVISLSDEIIKEVDRGLSPLKNDATKNQTDAESALTELKTEGGQEHAAEDVVAVQTDIKEAVKIATVDRDYQTAINKFKEAIVKAEKGIVKAKREKSRIALEKIEASLTTALVEGVQTFKAEEYRKSIELYENLLSDYNQGNYERVLEGSEVLYPRTQVLVIETKRAASDDRIVTMQGRIRELEEGGVLDYLPNSLERLNKYLADARTVRKEDTEAAFDQIKQMSIEASDEFERIRASFQQLANDEITKSQGEIAVTRAVYDRMEKIFEPAELPEDATTDQKVFESQKRARQTELAQQLENANTSLLTSQLRVTDGAFKRAILLAQEVRENAINIRGSIYHVVAHNATIELSKAISRGAREGAGVHAREELERSTKRLEEVKQATADGKYEQAVQMAAETRADVELMSQRIAARANEDLKAAKAALTLADESEKTKRHRQAEVDQVRGLIEEAAKDLTAERLKLALEKASNATELAKRAIKEASMIDAQDKISQAEKAVARAQDAGSQLYAGREVEDSRKLLSSAKTLFASEDYTKAEELAVSSAQRANNALFKKINEAEAEIASARSVGGWEYNDGRLAAANDKVREARTLLDQGQFDRSRAVAEDARSMAATLTAGAKDQDIAQRITRIQNNLEEGTSQGINFFQPEESIQIRKALADAQNSYTQKNYERVRSDLEKLEARLRQVLVTTETTVLTVAEQQEGRVERLSSEGADEFAAVELAEARESLRYAKLDYRRGLYKSAHSNLEKAITLINLVESRNAQEAYASQIEELFRDYRDAQLAFANVLSLDPEELKQLATGTGGAAQSVAISSQISPMQFREKVDRIYSRSLVVKVPAGLESIHEATLQSFSEGRLAALNFEKLSILNRAGNKEAYALIDEAYARMNTSNRQMADVQKRLIADEARFRLIQGGTRTLVGASR